MHPGKDDCLVLDVVGATGRNDLKTLNDITDHQLEIHEDERLDQAAKRTYGEREVMAGEAFISGSLEAIDIDPWAVELMRGRPRNAQGRPMTDEELAEEERLREEERAAKEVEKERREKRRYKHVPMRSGWFLRTPRNRFFIPLDTAAGQKGFIVVLEAGNGHHVALWLQGTTSQLLRSCDGEAPACRFALAFTLGLVEQAMERYVVDPDARWRRKPASESQIRYAKTLVQGVDFDEYHYSGQVSDVINWGRLHRNVDTFADSIASEVKSGSLTGATA